MEPVDERWAWVALAEVPGVGIGGQRYHDLLRLGPPAELFGASRARLLDVTSPAIAEGVVRTDGPGVVREQRRRALACDARLVLLGDAEYPAALAGLERPPPFLIVRGELRREDGLAVAIVGSRAATSYGARVAERLGRDLAERGVTVVSGAARGVDTAAHQGALGGGGRTVAVLGCGADVVYPPENASLLSRIVAAGAVVSQFPLGTRPLAHHFPVRNHVLAALGVGGTVVVEATERSGALITARLAAELGRDVFAVPGQVTSPLSDGPHRLIQDGAKLVRGWEDVVAEWPETWRKALRAAVRPPGLAAPVGEREAQILAALGNEPLDVDTLSELTGLPSRQVAAGLTELELSGLVRAAGTQRYVRGG